MPIGLAYTSVTLDSIDEFVDYMQCGYQLEANWDRAYNHWQTSFEERRIEGVLTYVVQHEKSGEYEYYYGYYITGGKAEIDTISVELDVNGTAMRYYCNEYNFGTNTVYMYEVNSDVVSYSYRTDGSVVVLTTAKEFANYKSLIILLSTGVAVMAAGTVILLGFTIKLRRIKDA
jgi:hypothetical protein